MIKFLFKGLIRDRSRSFFPLFTVAAGVLLTVVLYNWLGGFEDSLIRTSARLDAGHVKVMTRAYAEEADQIPNDLALVETGALLESLKTHYFGLIWTPRIKFGGLLDIPDENGETKAQGPVAGIAVDLFSPGGKEREILNLGKAVVRGRLPENTGEILISDAFARKLGVEPGETATLISSTMYGSMSMANFIVSGTIRFGVMAMDRGAMVADLGDVRSTLDMQDSAGEILGFFDDLLFRDKKAIPLAASFNSRYEKTDDEFAPMMVTLKEQGGLGDMLNMTQQYIWIFYSIFIAVMSIVLWNAGLMGSLRRYGEMGMRLAIGENHGHIYRTLVLESTVIGFFGTVFGTLLGLAISYYLQAKGINIASLMENASIMMPEVMRARVSLSSYVVGFIPGMLATLIGSSISGLGIYKRQTAQLFKELEV